MKHYLYFCALLFSNINFSQNSYTLNTNNASAIINSDGIFFYNSTTNSPGYGMISDNGASGIYNCNFWIGGLDSNDSLHTCLTGFSNSNFKSGPIAQNYTDANYLNRYDQKIWVISEDEVNYHLLNYNNANYSIPNNILNWPANGDITNGESQSLAMYNDSNNNGYYDPENGDYPIIRGDKAAYLIFNDDNGSLSENTMGFEYHFMYYQFSSNDNYLNNTTFLRLTIFNRNGINYHNLRVAQYADFDIGNGTDDLVGCDSSRYMVFGYNSDNIDDGGGNISFGTKPPAFGIKQLNQPMDVAIDFSYPNTSNTSLELQSWQRMNGFWNDTLHLSFGGDGFGGDTLTNYIYSGNPYTQSGWWNGNTIPSDKRILMSTGNGSLLSGESVCIDYAYIYSRDGANNFENVNTLYAVADSIQNFYNNQTNFYCPNGNILLTTNNIDKLNELSILPNPNKGDFTVNFAGNYNLKIFSINGTLVLNRNNLSNNSSMEINQPKGLYIVQVEQGGSFYYEKIIIE